MDNRMSAAYDDYFDIAYFYLEDMGAEGKMMLAALLKDENAFYTAYQQYREDQALRYV
jgi:hypothetical protein